VSKKVGLALGGGGARGWAHIGVIRALEEHNVPIDCIAGTSIGALVGAIYAKEKLHKLEEFACEIGIETLVSLMDLSFPGLGLIDGQRVRDFLTSYLVDTKIEESRIPFRCVATNFLQKEEVVFDSGSMVDAVRASISLPGIFVPCKHESTYLVDGGVVNPVPVNVVEAMGADVIIAVNLNHDPKTLEPDSQNESADRCAEDTGNDAPAGDDPESNQEIPQDAQDTDLAQQDQEQAQAESSLAQRLAERYQNLKDNLEDQINGWMPDPETGLNIFDVIGNSINMMEQQVTRVRLESHAPDVLIEPDLMEFGIFDFQQAQPMIQRGYDAAKALMSQIEAATSSSDSAETGSF
jgi:NTE family protein